MEQPTKIEQLRISIDTLSGLSEELAKRSQEKMKESGDNPSSSGDLTAASALLTEYSTALRTEYEQIPAAYQKPDIKSAFPTDNVGFTTNAGEQV